MELVSQKGLPGTQVMGLSEAPQTAALSQPQLHAHHPIDADHVLRREHANPRLKPQFRSGSDLVGHRLSGFAVHLHIKGAVGDPLRTQVCGECGLTELYANDPGALWETFKAAGGGS